MRLLIALTALLVLAPAASAATVTRSGGTITFTAGAGEPNYVNASGSSGSGWTIGSEEGLFGPGLQPSLAAAPGCSWNAGLERVECGAAPAVTLWDLRGLDENDILNAFGARAVIDGGEGNDQIDAGV